MSTMIAAAEPALARERRGAAIRGWLFAVAALMLATVVVGGATRLTQSGLSIVEWRPVTGVVPPLSEAAWQAELAKYAQTTQYRETNPGMTLGAFKTIFWWEWAHRMLGRLVGASFFVPFAWLTWRRRLDAALRRRLWVIFGLGALQGVVGFWMVASGLAGRIDVSQYRLAVHMLLGSGLFALVLWTAFAASPRRPYLVTRRVRAVAYALVPLVLLQIYLGAVVAGLHAGLCYRTWPLIDGRLLPPLSDVLHLSPVWRNAFENVLTVQLDHRLVAYVLFAGAAAHAIDAERSRCDTPVRRGALLLTGAVTAQGALGVATLLFGVPLALALAHQALGMLVLALAVRHAVTSGPQPSESNRGQSPLRGATEAEAAAYSSSAQANVGVGVGRGWQESPHSS